MTLWTQTLPLFPLDVVLFPGMVLPLHIFEERYRAMVRHCVASGEPFGLLWSDEESIFPASERSLIGTTAVITAVESLADGRFNINTVGSERFRVLDFSFDEPYLVGNVEPYPYTEPDSPLARAQYPLLSGLLKRYVALLDRVADNEIILEDMPEDPLNLAHLVAMYYQCQNWRKQELLAIESVPELMAREIELLRVEIPLVEQITSYREQGRIPPMLAGPFSIFGLS